MAIILLDGFEHGVFSTAGSGLYNTVSGTPTSETSLIPSGSGLRSMKCDSGAAATSVEITLASATLYVCQFQFMIPSSVSSGIEGLISRFGGSGMNCFFIANTTSNTFYVQLTEGVTPVNSSTYTFSRDVWYRVTARLNVGANPWVADWSVNGVSQTRVTKATAATDINVFTVGTSFGSSSWLVYLDDAVVGDASGDYPMNYVVKASSPSASGTHNLDASPSVYFGSNAGSDTFLSSGETTAYTRVDDVPLDGSTDYMFVTGTPTSGLYAELQLADFVSTSEPAAVRIVECVRQATAGGSSYTSNLAYSGSELTMSSAVDPNSATNVYKKALSTTKPGGGGWTLAALNGTTYRLGYTTDATPEIRLNSLIVEAAFPQQFFATRFRSKLRTSRGVSWT